MTESISERVTAIVKDGRALETAGDAAGARASYLAAWELARTDDDALSMSIAAHYVAIAENDPDKKLAWNLDALRLAEGLPNQTPVRGFYASLFANLGLSYSLLGRRAEAVTHYEHAAERVSDIEPGPYADMVRGGIDRALARLRESA